MGAVVGDTLVGPEMNKCWMEWGSRCREDRSLSVLEVLWVPNNYLFEGEDSEEWTFCYKSDQAP